MALMVLFFTQCKPTPEGGDENSRKVKVSCSIPMGKNNRSDFSELMTEGAEVMRQLAERRANEKNK